MKALDDSEAPKTKRLFCRRDFKFELPSTKIERLSICEETVRDPRRRLEALLRELEEGGIDGNDDRP